MTETTVCPACGGMIEFEGDEDVIRCPFCGDEFEVDKQGDEPVLRVRDQPAPQKEVLSAPARDLAEEAARQASEAREAAASNIPASAAGVTPASTAQTVSGAQTTYQATGETVRPAGDSNRWIFIALAAFVVACLACACVAGAALVISNSTMGTFNF